MMPVFKTELIKRRFEKLHPKAQEILLDMIAWAHEQGIHAIVTETATTYEEDLKLNRTSASHREARAFDISTKGWQMPEIFEFQRYFNAKFGSFGAHSKSTGKQNLIVHHDAGSGPHFHVQLSREHAIHWEKEMEG